MSAPRFVFEEMGDYERSLAEMRRHYTRMRTATSPAERAAAQAEYDRALQQARALGARLARELHAAAAAQ